jgi:hypothetical protein
MSELKLKALKARYTAQRLEALATIEVYMSNSVGIGEHPQIIDEIDKLVRSVDEADGLLKTLNSIFKVEEAEETKYSGEKEAPKQPEN